jgi:thiamine-monophosphate kinase
MDEFEIIRLFFQKQQAISSIPIGIGDDGAIVQPSSNKNLIVTTDTSISGVHFPVNSEVSDIGYRAVVVNVSDIAAMGGNAKWMTLALTLNVFDHSWLDRFSKGLFEAAKEYGISLIGGDTTRGEDNIITIQMIGEVNPDEEITRNKAKEGDLIFVTGTVGDAAAGLDQFVSHEPKNIYLMKRFFRPSARIEIGQALKNIASSAIDISDGLYADTQKLLKASGLGGHLKIDQIPLSDEIIKLYNEKMIIDFALSGGDDYELLFTAPNDSLTKIQRISNQLNQRITVIGEVDNSMKMRCSNNGKPFEYYSDGYLHFK